MTTNNGNDETQVGGGGGDATRVGGSPPATPDDSGANRKTWMIALGILIVGLLIGVGVAVAGSGGDDDKQASDDTSTSTSSTSTSTTSTTLGATTTTNGGTSPTGPSDDPRINSFSANKNSPYNCTPSAPDASGPTAPNFVGVTLSWTTDNTTSVEFLQNGGLYQSFGGGNNQVNLTPGCSDQTLTWTIKASGPNGPEAVRTITFQINNTTEN